MTTLTSLAYLAIYGMLAWRVMSALTRSMNNRYESIKPLTPVERRCGELAGLCQEDAYRCAREGRKEPMAHIDIKTLVVGQQVHIVSGDTYYRKGEVVKITPSHVYVLPDEYTETLWRFDNDGKSCDGVGTPEGGPWYIIDDKRLSELDSEIAGRILEETFGGR